MRSSNVEFLFFYSLKSLAADVSFNYNTEISTKYDAKEDSQDAQKEDYCAVFSFAFIKCKKHVFYNNF